MPLLGTLKATQTFKKRTPPICFPLLSGIRSRSRVAQHLVCHMMGAVDGNNFCIAYVWLSPFHPLNFNVDLVFGVLERASERKQFRKLMPRNIFNIEIGGWGGAAVHLIMCSLGAVFSPAVSFVFYLRNCCRQLSEHVYIMPHLCQVNIHEGDGAHDMSPPC